MTSFVIEMVGIWITQCGLLFWIFSVIEIKLFGFKLRHFIFYRVFPFMLFVSFGVFLVVWLCRFFEVV
jgi:hypothetical protein